MQNPILWGCCPRFSRTGDAKPHHRPPLNIQTQCLSIDASNVLNMQLVAVFNRPWQCSCETSVLRLPPLEVCSRVRACAPLDDRNLVDPASSHTLVSKIKPCMSKYKHYTVKLRMAHYISYSLFDSPYYLDNRSNSRANTCVNSRLLCKTEVFIRYNQPFGSLVNHNN
jgi:hypothetical protein